MPGVASHTFTVPSAPAVTRRLPSGWNATPRTIRPCPPSNTASPPGSGVASHTRTWLYRETDASFCPSGLNATPSTPPVISRRANTSCPVAASQNLTDLP